MEHVANCEGCGCMLLGYTFSASTLCADCHEYGPPEKVEDDDEDEGDS